MKFYINDEYMFNIDSIKDLKDGRFNFIINNAKTFKRSVLDEYFYAKTLITSLYVLSEDNDVLWNKNDYNTKLNSCDIVEFKIMGNKVIITVNLY